MEESYWVDRPQYLPGPYSDADSMKDRWLSSPNCYLCPNLTSFWSHLRLEIVKWMTKIFGLNSLAREVKAKVELCIMTVFKDTTDPQKTPTLSKPPRRGTTGMVQRLESCHIWDIEGKPVPSTSRSGSLPLGPPTTNPNANPNLQRSPTTPNTSGPSPQFLSFAPFMSIPWWTSPCTELQDAPMMQNELFSIQPEHKASQKRKREGKVEQYMPHPIHPTPLTSPESST